MRSHSVTFSAVVLLCAVPATLPAQDTIQVGVRTPLPPGEELPAQVAQELVAYYNSPSTIRFSGRTEVPADRTIGGDVAVLGGPLELAGRIDGEVLVLNGDIALRDGSRIRGDLTVVGGLIIGVERGRVDGTITTYPTAFRYRRTEDGIEYLGPGPPGETRPVGRRIMLPSWELGESQIFVSARAYNRVEGLPIAFGPRITTGGRNPLRLEAFLIWRTVGGFDPEESDLGWELRLRQWLGGHRSFWLEAAYWSIVDPIESWKLTNLENSLTVFFFKRDYRDYYERKGWYGRLAWRSSSLFGSLEFRDEEHNSRIARDPWTIFWNTGDEFRPNATIDDGDLQSVALTLRMDTRNDPDQPLSGWYNELRLEQAVGGRLGGVKQSFTHLFLDLRRYNRVSRNSVLAFRLAGGGRLGDERTPAQREHMIGGTGSLPGSSMMEFDCGVRSSGLIGSEPGYGCQRFTLFQAEYRTGLNFRYHWDHKQIPDISGDIFSVQFSPAIVLFFNAGAAWNAEDWFDYLADSDNWVTDVGAGLDLGGFGAYVAYPLVGSGEVNFFVRLTARF
ncbi:MAG: BamA/TamA family outer membrane protein [Gemmatimonadetes bacterium]|nr:BamA/TamA family outer membrane protein [Gemmatimonadota bacterium]NIO31111.1 BamA/TamA family outer membrane protein [Gemmatimonadota bacterium]